MPAFRSIPGLNGLKGLIVFVQNVTTQVALVPVQRQYGNVPTVMVTIVLFIGEALH